MKKKLKEPDDLLVKAGWQRDPETGLSELHYLLLAAMIKISNEQS